jgi:hypothetical protein
VEYRCCVNYQCLTRVPKSPHNYERSNVVVNESDRFARREWQVRYNESPDQFFTEERATSAAFFRWLRYEQFSVPTCRSGQALRLGDVASFLLPVGSSVGRLGASEMYGEQYPAPNRVSVLESSSVFLADLIPSRCDAVMGSLSLSSLSFPLSPLTDFLPTELVLSLQNI